MRKLILLLLALSFIAPALTGCFDAKEVTEYAYVYSIGLDKGVTDKLRMTVQIPDMKGEQTGGGGGGGGGSQGQGDISTFTIDCPSFYSGVNMINTFLSRQLNYMHAKFLVFSEALAREGIANYLTAFNRGRQLRRNMSVIICRGPSSEFLKQNTVVIGSSLSKKQQNLMDQSRNNGLFSRATYGDMLNDAKASYGQSIAILAAINNFSHLLDLQGSGNVPAKSTGVHSAGELARVGGSKDEFLGTALFNGGKMVGELNGDETRTMLMIRDEYVRAFYSVDDPKKSGLTITMDVMKGRSPEITVKTENETPAIYLKVFLEGDLIGVQSTIDYESKEWKSILEEAFQTQIKDQLEKTIRKCQALGTDVFKFGRVAAMKYWTIQEWESADWLNRFRSAKVTVDVGFKIRRTGTMIKSSEFYTTEGKKGE